MNKEQAQQILPWIQAISEGKVVECRYKGDATSSSVWVEWTLSYFDFDDYEYRIKFEDTYVWLNVYELDGNLEAGAHKTRDTADKFNGSYRVGCIKVMLEKRYDD